MESCLGAGCFCCLLVRVVGVVGVGFRTEGGCVLGGSRLWIMGFGGGFL